MITYRLINYLVCSNRITALLERFTCYIQLNWFYKSLILTIISHIIISLINILDHTILIITIHAIYKDILYLNILHRSFTNIIITLIITYRLNYTLNEINNSFQSLLLVIIITPNSILLSYLAYY